MKLLIFLLVLSVAVCFPSPSEEYNSQDLKEKMTAFSDESRIMGGKVPHTLVDFKFMVRISIPTLEGQDRCGGTVISSSTVLTAAHCFDDYDDEEVILIYVYRGLFGLEDLTQMATVKQKHIHENYFKTRVRLGDRIFLAESDIALLILNEELTKPTSFVNLEQLTRPLAIRYHKKAIIAGWGVMDPYNGSTASDILLTNELYIITNQECQNDFIDYLSIRFIRKSHICAKSEENNNGVAKGDSGGPLLIRNHDGSFTQIGIISFKLRNNQVAGLPFIFTRLSKFREWIHSKTGL